MLNNIIIKSQTIVYFCTLKYYQKNKMKKISLVL